MKGTKRSWVFTGIIFVGIVIIGVVIFLVPRRPPIEKLKIGGHTTIVSIVLEVTEEMGLFSEEGLDVEVIPVKSSKHSMAAMESGELNIVIGSLSAGSFNMVAKGNLSIIADAARVIPSIVIRRDLWNSKTIENLVDLKGKSIRIPREGSISYFALAKILRSVDLEIEDIVPKYLKEKETIAALEARHLDAAILNEPYATNAVEKDIGIRYDMDKIAAIFPENGQQHMVLYTTVRMLVQPEVLKKFLKAYVKGIEMYDKGRRGIEPERSKVTKVITAYTGVVEEVVRKSVWPYVSLDGRPDVQYLEEVQDYFFQKELIEEKIDIEKVVDLRFLP